MTLRPWKILRLCFVIFMQANAVELACLAKELDADIAERLEPFRNRRLTPERRKQFREDLFRLPDWEIRLAQAMAKLAVASRYDGAMDQRRWEMRELFEKKENGKLSPDEMQQLQDFSLWMLAESKVVGRATQARTELQSILNALGEMGDERAIPFLGPILAERGAVIDQFSDAPTATPQRIAFEALDVANS